MCHECKFGEHSGLRNLWNVFRHLVDKLTGLDELQYSNLCRSLELPKDLGNALRAELRQELHQHGEAYRNTWRFAIFFRRRLDHYENVR